MPPILVPSSAKRIATQILVIAKLNEREGFILRGFVCDIILPYKELPVQRQQLKHNENCSILRKKTLGKYQSCCSSVYIVKCKYISNCLLIVDFEQANVFWVHTEKINTFEEKIKYITRYIVVIYQHFSTKIYQQITFEVINENPTRESLRNFYDEVHFKR